MLKNWFKPKWKHSNPSVRIKAIARLNPNYHDHRSILLALVQSDDSADVRRTAIQQMNDWKALVGLLSSTDQVVLSAVRIRLFELLEANRFASPHRRAEMAKETSDLILMRRILETSEDLETKTQLITMLEDQQLLVELSSSLPTSQLRLLAAGQIEDPIALEDALELAKSRDKGVYHLVKKRLRQMQEDQIAALNIEEQVDDLCIRAEQLAYRSVDNLYGAQLDYLESAWAGVAQHASENQINRFTEACSLCRDMLLDQKIEQSIPANQGVGIAGPYNNVISQLKQSSAIDFVVSMDNKVRQICSRAWEPSVRDELRSIIQDREAEWESLEDGVTVEEQYRLLQSKVVEYIDASDLAINAEPEAIALLERPIDGLHINQIQSLRDRIEAVLDNLCWPKDFPKPYYLAALKERKYELKKQHDRLEQDINKILAWLTQSLVTLEKYIDDGISDAATVLVRECQKQMFVIPDDRGRELRQSLARCQQRLRDLKDWKEYVTLPKRSELVERMRELIIDEPQDIEQHASTIENLRSQWRELGRFSGAAAKAFAADFDMAAEQAYLPCRSYFAQKDRLKKENSEKRAHFCDQLEEYMRASDWGEDFNWDVATEIFFSAKKEWKSYSPFCRDNASLLQNRFDTVLNDLKKKLDTYWGENKKQKLDLITQATQLLSEHDLRQATESAKKLQNQWKLVGSAQKKNDHRLWQEFKKLNDQLFEKVRAERDAEQNLQEIQIQKSFRLVDSIEELASVVPADWGHCWSQITHFRTEFHELENLPKQVQADCLSRIESAVKQFKLSEQEHARQRKLIAVNRFWHDLAEVESIERQALRDGRPVEDSLVNLRNNLATGDRERYAPLIERLEKLLGFDEESCRKFSDYCLPEQQGELERLKRELCIRMELLAGLDSPDEDKISRMALQVSRLNDEWKKRTDDLTELEQIERLQAEWASLPIISDRYLDNSLLVRFQAAAEQLCSPVVSAD